MRVSFDFDSTLTNPDIQNLAKWFIKAGCEVCITTSRMQNPHPQATWSNDEVTKICDIVGIPKENIRFTNCQDKWLFLEGFDMHFDDDYVEIDLLKENLPSCRAIHVNYD